MVHTGTSHPTEKERKKIEETEDLDTSKCPPP